jgi:hypothetical protein
MWDVTYKAVDIEAGVPPGENALGPFRAQQLLADKHRQDLPGEDLRQPRVVEPRDLMEDTPFVRATLGHQEMEVHVKVDPVGSQLKAAQFTEALGLIKGIIETERGPQK